jgi:hypothetical protein
VFWLVCLRKLERGWGGGHQYGILSSVHRFVWLYTKLFTGIFIQLADSVGVERGGNSWGNNSSSNIASQDQQQREDNSWHSSARNDQFDIGTWENPGGDTGGTSGGGANGSGTAGDSSGWSTATDAVDNAKGWSSGSNWSTGGGDVATPAAGGQPFGEWGKDSASGSVELSSPSSQWKKEGAVSSVGNWADAVPSPRSDQEDNPLNVSLETVVRKIVW